MQKSRNIKINNQGLLGFQCKQLPSFINIKAANYKSCSARPTEIPRTMATAFEWGSQINAANNRSQLASHVPHDASANALKR